MSLRGSARKIFISEDNVHSKATMKNTNTLVSKIKEVRGKETNNQAARPISNGLNSSPAFFVQVNLRSRFTSGAKRNLLLNALPWL